MKRTRIAPILAIACGLAAAWGVHRQQRELSAQAGPQAPAIIARASLMRGDRIDDERAATAFVRGGVPRQLLPQGALRETNELAGATLATDIPRGTIVSNSHLVAPDGGDRRVRPGQRLIDLPVQFAGGAAPRPGDLVDVIAAGEAGGGFAELVLAGAKVESAEAGAVAMSPGSATDSEPGPVAGRVTLVVTLRQVARLLAARAGGAELSIVNRPPGDRSMSGPVIERLRAATG